MKKSKQWSYVVSFMSILMMVLTFQGIQGSLTAYADRVSETALTKLDYGDRDDDYPISFSFKYVNASVNAEAHNRYNYYVYNKKSNVFYEEYYMNKFHWYSMVPRQGATKTEAYMALMWENMQDVYGKTGAYMANGNHCRTGKISNWANRSAEYRYNIKMGRIDPWSGQYLRFNSGTQVVSNGIYEGCNYEWRYLGYTVDGEAIENPYFPADYPTNDLNWKNRNWVVYPWTKGYKNFNKTLYDSSPKKAEWIEEKLLPLYWGLRGVTGKGNKADAIWWADRFSVRANPDLGSGIATGYHIRNGHLYYVTFVMDATPRPNLRLTEMTVKPKTSSQINGTITRSKTNNEDFTVKENMVYDKVRRGVEYEITAKVKNMKVEGLDAKDTTYTPIHLDLLLSFDEDVFEFNDYSYVFEGEEGCAPVDPNKTTIKYGEEVEYKCTIEMPFEFEKYVLLGLRIPNGFFLAGENINNQDDVSEMILQMPPEDMALTAVEVRDEDDMLVDHVSRGMFYDANFYVKKVEGDTPIGSNNPFAKVIAEGTDFGAVSRTAVVTATDVIYPNKTVRIKAENFIAPQTTRLKVCGTIHPEHYSTGMNQNNGNDGPKCSEFATEVNLAVKDLQIIKSLYDLPRNKSYTHENLTFNFRAVYTNEDKKNARTETVRIVIRKKGSSVPLAQTYVSLAPNVPGGTPMSIAVNNVYLPVGNNGFEVEINPVPRTVFEYKKYNQDPYDDNIQSGNVLVRQNVSIADICRTPHKENRWTTTYYEYQVNGYWKSQTCTGYSYSTDSKGNLIATPYSYDCSGCVTTSTSSWTTRVSHYETFEITNVYFRSKYTKDNQGGWVDIKHQPGKVKAGYGFELRVVTLYRTNVFSASPKPWYAGCSYKTVTPQPDTYSVSHTVKMTLPFADKGGTKMSITMQGSVDNGYIENYKTTHYMPVRNAFGLKDTREIFINERARDGIYQVDIGTTSFYGSGLKPSTNKYLCDKLTVNIQVIGANSDDVNTHITH